ncbi:MAG: NYN domain-containing protein [Spirochaetales bacterium]|nr:NYN domain-containing protein [Spirochaetales bacterium]
MDNQRQPRLAVLIDADNAAPSIIEGLLEEVANLGIASVKRIYGDWTSPNLKGWKEELLRFGLQPIQQFSYTTGKNSTDSALIIDAMDLLYSKTLDGFCVVSSDSDFTRLSARLREGGMMVYGFGEKKTPKAFVGACDRFIYTENLRVEPEKETEQQHRNKRMNSNELKQDSWLVNAIRNALEDLADDDGWANLGTLGQAISNKYPDFDTRNYGYQKLGELIRAIGLFEFDSRATPNSPSKSIYIRDIRKRK